MNARARGRVARALEAFPAVRLAYLYGSFLPHVRGSWRPLRNFARSVARKALRRLGPKA